MNCVQKTSQNIADIQKIICLPFSSLHMQHFFFKILIFFFIFINWYRLYESSIIHYNSFSLQLPPYTHNSKGREVCTYMLPYDSSSLHPDLLYLLSHIIFTSFSYTRFRLLRFHYLRKLGKKQRKFLSERHTTFRRQENLKNTFSFSPFLNNRTISDCI